MKVLQKVLHKLIETWKGKLNHAKQNHAKQEICFMSFEKKNEKITQFLLAGNFFLISTNLLIFLIHMETNSNSTSNSAGISTTTITNA